MTPDYSISLSFLKPVLSIYRFYYDGFKSMTVGKKLWAIIFIKLFIMFAILKVFFFPDFLHSNFKTNEDRSTYVLEQITKKNN